MKRMLLACAAVAASVPVASAQAAPASRSVALDRARTAIAADAPAVRGGAHQAFHVRDVIRDGDGATHVRFTRTYRGLDVLGGDVVVHSAADGAFRGAGASLAGAPRASVR